MTPKRQFKKGETLLQEGEMGDCAYVIESGSVEIVINREGQQVQLGTRGPGSLIGEMAMIDDKPRTATIRAIEDCDVLEITREDFARRVDTADPVVRMVMRVIASRYRDLIVRSNVVTFLPTGEAEAAENNDRAHDVAVSTLKVHNELKIALDEKQLLLYYQPIIDVQNMKIAGFEALMRWRHPEKGLISPGVFIPVAEETGMIVELSRFALEVACEAAPQLQKAAAKHLVGDKPVFVGVNFSVKDFADRDIFDHISTTLTANSLDPAHIHLEVTESLLMEAPEPAKLALEKCREFGIDVSIDDFGTGYSSLSYLHYFPIDTLKIDQSFVRAMSKHKASLVLVKSIISLAKNLGMKVIAEGIETQEEAKIIRDLGCEWVQGFWFAKPMPFEDALQFMKNWQPPQL